jgi:hypothetical protein
VAYVELAFGRVDGVILQKHSTSASVDQTQSLGPADVPAPIQPTREETGGAASDPGP